jgi:hypothetical protein
MSEHQYTLIYRVNNELDEVNRELISWQKRSKLFAVLLARWVQCPYFGSTLLPNGIPFAALH